MMTPVPIELTVILKNEDKQYKEKFLCYEPLVLNESNERLNFYIEEAKKSFIEKPLEIIVKAMCQII